ncbi:MAG: hypothetical protein K2J32_11490 [Ruminococcus sp.]|nr:hypothetical protein [Ruminococcus sp.]
MKKFIILACAFMLACVSCSEESSGSLGESKNMLVNDNAYDGLNANEDELPFGATMIDLYPDEVPISISYEKRFMTADEAKKISDYISAINTCDAELIQKTSYQPYLEYLVEYYENTDIQDYLDTRHQIIVDSYTNGEYDFNYILINSLKDENYDDSDTGFSQLDAKIYEKSPDAEITSRKMVEIDILYSLENDNGSYSFSRRTGSDMTLYIYTIDGQIYIL